MSKRSIRRVIVLELLNHVKSAYDYELPEEDVRTMMYSDAGIEALLSFRSDSRLDDLRGALQRLEAGTFGLCIACKTPIARIHLEGNITRRICPSCEAGLSHRRLAAGGTGVPALHR